MPKHLPAIILLQPPCPCNRLFSLPKCLLHLPGFRPVLRFRRDRFGHGTKVSWPPESHKRNLPVDKVDIGDKSALLETVRRDRLRQPFLPARGVAALAVLTVLGFAFAPTFTFALGFGALGFAALAAPPKS